MKANRIKVLVVAGLLVTLLVSRASAAPTPCDSGPPAPIEGEAVKTGVRLGDLLSSTQRREHPPESVQLGVDFIALEGVYQGDVYFAVWDEFHPGILIPLGDPDSIVIVYTEDGGRWVNRIEGQRIDHLIWYAE